MRKREWKFILASLVLIALIYFATTTQPSDSPTGLTFVEGNESTIATTGITNFTVHINGAALNTTHNYTGNLLVEFFDGITLLANFTFDFTNDVLNLSNISVEQGNGIAITNLSLNKALFVPKNNTNNVCVEDVPAANLNSISFACDNGAEVAITCNGTTQMGYTCTSFNANYWQVTGLQNSAVAPISLSISSLNFPSLGQGATTSVIVNGSGFETGTSATITNTEINITNQSFINTSTFNVTVIVDLNASLGNYTLTLTNPDGNHTNTTLAIELGPFIDHVHIYYDSNITNQTIHYNASVWAAPGVDIFTTNISNTTLILQNSTHNPVNITMEFQGYNTTVHHGSVLWGIYVNGSAIVPISGVWNASKLTTTATQTTPPCSGNCSKFWEGYSPDYVYNGDAGLGATISPNCNGTADFSGTEGVFQNDSIPVQVTGIGILVNPITVTLNSGSIPPGMSLENGNNNPRLAGTPTTAGTYTFEIRVDDSGLDVNSGPSDFCQKVIVAAAGGGGGASSSGGGGGGGGGVRYYKTQLAIQEQTQQTLPTYIVPPIRDNPNVRKAPAPAEPEVIEATLTQETSRVVEETTTEPTIPREPLRETTSPLQWFYYGFAFMALFGIALSYYIRHHK